MASEEQSAAEKLARSISQCQICSKIDFTRISASSLGRKDTMNAFTCTQIAECLQLQSENQRKYMQANGQPPPPTICPLGQLKYDALEILLYDLECLQPVYIALNK